MKRFLVACPGARWLLLVNLLDLVVTTVLLTHGVAREANPVFRWLWERSPLLFSTAKMLWVSLWFWVLSILYKRRPAAVDTLTWLGFWTYLVMLVSAIIAMVFR